MRLARFDSRPAPGGEVWRGTPLVMLAVLGAVVAQIGYYLIVWRALLSIPSLFGVDFVAFYAAGRIAQDGPMEQLYDLRRQAAIQLPIVGTDYVDGGVLPFNHPPFLAPLLALLVDSDYRASYLRWCALLIAALVGVGAAVRALLLRYGWEAAAATVMGISAAVMYPMYNGVLKGQDAAFMLLGAAVWMAAALGGRDVLAGAALALTVVKPQVALALAIPLLATRRWRMLAGFAATAGLLTIASVLLVGPRGVADFLGVLQLSSSGVGYGFNPEAMYNLTGMVLRAAPGAAPEMLGVLRWPAFLAGIAACAWLWRAGSGGLTPARIGAAVCVALFLSPHLHFHDLGLLLLPILAIALWLWRMGGAWRGAALALPSACSFYMLLTDVLPGGWPFLASTALLLALLALCLDELRRGAASEAR